MLDLLGMRDGGFDVGGVIGDKVEILDGLKDGDVVITTGQINLTNGSKIEIIK